MPRRVWATFRANLLGDFFWNALAVGSLQGSLFLGHLLVARIVGRLEFGNYAVLLATATALGAIAQSGLGFVAAKYIAEWHLVDRARAGRVMSLCRFAGLALGGTSGAVIMATSAPIALHLFQRADFSEDLFVLGFATPMLALAAYQQGALQGFGAFRAAGICGAVAALVHVAATVIGAMTAGVFGAISALVLGAAVRVGLLALALGYVARSHDVNAAFWDFKAEARLLWTAGLPAALMGVTVGTAFWIVSLILLRSPQGAESVGGFFAANQLRLLALQLPIVLTGVTVSALNRMRGRQEWTSYRSVFMTNLTVNITVAALIVVCAGLFADQLLALYGQRFRGSPQILRVLMISILPELIASAVFLHVQARERMWVSFFFAWLPKDVVFIAGSAVAGVWAATAALGTAWSYVAAWTFAAVAFTAIALRLGFEDEPPRPNASIR